MTTERFWQIIEVTSASTQEEQLDLFKSELQQLSIPELIEFKKNFSELFFAAYNWDLWLVAWLCQGGMCSDDSFSDFRFWLISRGRAVYEGALQDPDALVEEILEAQNPSFELFGYVPAQSYRTRTKEELPDSDLRRPKEPTGGDWLRPQLKDRTNSKMLNRSVVFNEMGDEEFSAIEHRFPRVWEFCIRQGIIKIGQPDSGLKQSAAERILTPEEVAKSQIDPNLEKTNFPAYLKALYDATRNEYNRRKTKE